MSRRFSLVGPGRVGSSLALALSRHGWTCDAIVAGANNGSGIRELRKRFPSSKIIRSLSSLGSDFDVLFLTVADGKIFATANELVKESGLPWEGKGVFHASGVVGVKALIGLKNSGALTGAFHPISPFASKFSPERAEGIFYDFYGDPRAVGIARRLASTLSSRLILPGSERERRLLHIASVIVSNFTVIGARAAENLLAGFVGPDDVGELIRGLLSSTANNLSNSTGGKSLTGPLARGDADVISSHLESLENKPLLLQLYKSSSLLGIDMVIREERDPNRRRNLKRIKKLLEE